MAAASADIKSGLDKQTGVTTLPGLVPASGFTPGFDAQAKSKHEKDFLLPFVDLKRRAEAGDSSAQFLVGSSLRYGWYECVKNEVESIKWLEAAKQNENTPGGLCALGLCYGEGICGVVIKNKDKAKECYTKAMEQGYIPGMTALAIMLRKEAITTTKSTINYLEVTHEHKDDKKLAEAVRLLNIGAEAGYPVALRNLAMCYCSGYGVAEDKVQSLKLYRMAAEKGLSGAKRDIGIFYENGWGGVKRDVSEARKWFGMAAAQGYNIEDDLVRLSCCNSYNTHQDCGDSCSIM